MPCDVLDLRCIFVNEVFGSIALAVLFATIVYFIFTSKIRIGFRSSLVIFVPLVLIFSLALGGFALIYPFVTLFVAILLAIIVQKIIGNQGFI